MACITAQACCTALQHWRQQLYINTIDLVPSNHAVKEHVLHEITDVLPITSIIASVTTASNKISSCVCYTVTLVRISYAFHHMLGACRYLKHKRLDPVWRKAVLKKWFWTFGDTMPDVKSNMRWGCMEKMRSQMNFETWEAMLNDFLTVEEFAAFAEKSRGKTSCKHDSNNTHVYSIAQMSVVRACPLAAYCVSRPSGAALHSWYGLVCQPICIPKYKLHDAVYW